MSRQLSQPPATTPLQPPPLTPTSRAPPAWYRKTVGGIDLSTVPWDKVALLSAAVGVGALTLYLLFRAGGKRRSRGIPADLVSVIAVPQSSSRVRLHVADVVVSPLCPLAVLLLSFSERADALIDAIGRGEVDEFDAAEYREYLDTAHAEASAPSSAALCSPLACLALIRLFTSYHTVRNLVLATESGTVPPRDLMQRLAVLEQEQNEDLAKAWTILQQPAVQALHRQPPASTDQHLAEAQSAGAVVGYSDVKLLALEIAQRLKNSAFLMESFARLVALPPAEMSNEQVLAAFMTAPLLGKWRETRALGQRLIDRKGPNAMDEFHQAALQESVYPDYALLYAQAADLQNAANAQRTALVWEKYDVSQILVRHDQVSHSRSAAAVRLSNGPPIRCHRSRRLPLCSPSTPTPSRTRSCNRSWQANASRSVCDARSCPRHSDRRSLYSPLSPSLPLLRRSVVQREISPPPSSYLFIVTGAIARMQSPFIVELPCVGQYSHDRFSLGAYATIPSQSDPESGQDIPASWVEILIEVPHSPPLRILSPVQISLLHALTCLYPCMCFPLQCVREAVIDGGRERTFAGLFQVKEYAVIEGGDQAAPRKGPLSVMHQFNIEIALRRAQAW